MYKEISGNLITLAKAGVFDVIAHGCNCFCTMKSGIAPQMAREFGCDKFPYEDTLWRGEYNKLGMIDYQQIITENYRIRVVNCYTQYDYQNHTTQKNLDDQALILCLKKMNHLFKGKRIGLPQIGCGLAGGQWELIQPLVEGYLADCDVTVVIYDNT